MGRRPRDLADGEICHVVNHSALRAPLIADQVDAQLFRGAMRDALVRHPVDLLGWCLMPNRWHLLLRPQVGAALPALIRWLTLAHSRRWQARHGRPGQGTLYQGRYRSARIEGDDHLLTVLRYIERNPVRAGLVASAADWPWSSLGPRLRGRPARLAASPVPLPAHWLAHVDAPQTAGEEAAVRRAVSGGKAGRPRRVPVEEAVTDR